MKTDNATDRAWTYSKDLSAIVIFEDHKIKAIADFGKIEHHEANARLIVKAVNNFDAMLKVLKDLLKEVHQHIEDCPNIAEITKRADEAITNAEKDT